MKNANWIIIGILIAIILVLPRLNIGLFGIGDVYMSDSPTLLYQTFRSGSQCASNFYQSSINYGKLYIGDITAIVTYDSGIFRWNVPPEYCTSSVYFYEGASIPGTPYASCPPYSDASTASNFPSGGVSSDGKGTFCKTIQQYCIDENLPNYKLGQAASYDPDASNGIPEIKCNAYCKPNLGTCVMRTDGRWESQICAPEADRLIHKICLDECNAGSCTGSEAIYIDISPLNNLVIGEDVNAIPTLFFHEAPKSGEELVGTITQNLQIIAGPVTGFTDSQGKAILQFKNVQAVKGFAKILIKADIEGLVGQQEMDIYFDDIPPIMIDLPSTAQTYFYGDSITITPTLYLGATPQPNIVMIGEIWNNGIVISSDTQTTDATGKVNLNFYNVEAFGEAELKITAKNIGGRDKTAISKLTFSGSILKFASTTESYIQTNKEPIKFTVNVQDNQFRWITESQITNFQIISSLSYGQIIASSYKYLGDGDYAISVNVTGTGVFLGKVSFDYLGSNFTSPTIQIDVRVSAISIDTSKIPASSYINFTETIPFSFTDSTGNLIDPDTINVIISLPSGYQEKLLSKSDLTRVSLGVYSFQYTFLQVEKYTFDVYATKESLAEGHARGSTAISGTGTTGPGPSFGFGNLKYFLYAGIAIFIIIILLGRKKHE